MATASGSNIDSWAPSSENMHRSPRTLYLEHVRYFSVERLSGHAIAMIRSHGAFIYKYAISRLLFQ
jgi:hypothetical protein